MSLSKKRQEEIKELYKSTPIRWLFNVYDNYSDEKAEAEMKILNEMNELGGCDYKVLTYNRYNFTCAYRLNDTLVYHTAINRFVIRLYID